MSALEIEEAIRQLPAEEAAALLKRLRDLQSSEARLVPLSDEAINKWRVRSGFPAGLTTDEYLHIIRDGRRD